MGHAQACAGGALVTLTSREHYTLMEQFESDRNFPFSRRLDREDKTFWPMGRIYQDGRTNEAFLAYRSGYALGLFVARAEGS